MKKIHINLEKATADEMGPDGTVDEAQRYDRLVMHKVINNTRKRFPTYKPLAKLSSSTSVIVEPDDKYVQSEVYDIIKEAFVNVYKSRQWTDVYAQLTGSLDPMNHPIGLP